MKVEKILMENAEKMEKQRKAWGMIPTGGSVALAVSSCTFRKKRSKRVPISETAAKRPRRALKKRGS